MFLCIYIIWQYDDTGYICLYTLYMLAFVDLFKNRIEQDYLRKQKHWARFLSISFVKQERTVGFLAASVFSVAYVASPIHVLHSRQWEAHDWRERCRVVTPNSNPEVGALAVLVPAEAGVVSEGHKTISSVLFCHSTGTGSAALIGGLQ